MYPVLCIQKSPVFELFVFNPSDAPVSLKGNEDIGKIHFVMEVSEQSPVVEGVVRGVVVGEPEVPPHLQKLWERAKMNLDEAQQQQLLILLCEFSGVFAQHEFDLGDFTLIEHRIDTGDAAPIKQKMWAVPQ